MLRYIIFLFISIIVLFNKITINKLLEFSLSKWFNKKIEIENLDISYLNQRLNLENVKINNEDQNKDYNLLDIEKIVIEIKKSNNPEITGVIGINNLGKYTLVKIPAFATKLSDDLVIAVAK